MKVRQLSTIRPGRKLRWTHSEGQSVRAYLSGRDEEGCPCVSTQSAELTIILDGEIAVDVGPVGQTSRVNQGDACWVPRGTPHAFRVSRETRALIVDCWGSSGSTSELDELDDTGLRHLPARAIPARLFRGFEAAWKRPPSEALVTISGAASEIVSRLGARAPMVTESASSTGKMMLAKRIIEEHYARPSFARADSLPLPARARPTLAQLSKMVGTSKFYLLRNFKRHFTFTPYAYAQFLRTERFFWTLLQSPNRSLLDLSVDAGFGDYSTFERRMRTICGRAPSRLIDIRAAEKIGPT